MWTERPVTPNVVEAAVRSVKHLFALRTAIMLEVNADLQHGQNIYMRVVSEKSDASAQQARKMDHRLPVEFKDLLSQQVKRRSDFIQREQSEEVYDDNGFRWNVPGKSADAHLLGRPVFRRVGPGQVRAEILKKSLVPFKLWVFSPLGAFSCKFGNCVVLSNSMKICSISTLNYPNY